MSAGQRREVAHRVFAAEFDDATVSVTESDDDMAPSYVLVPTGALVNRVFVVGVLTAVDQVGDDIYRGRITDPTGTFVTYAGQYQPNAANFLADATTPTIVGVTAKARTFTPDGSDDVLSSLRPERIVSTTPATRDRWVHEAARHTLGRIAIFAQARQGNASSDAVVESLRQRGVVDPLARGIGRAVESYGTTAAYLTALRRCSLEAVAVIDGSRESVTPLNLATDAVDPDATFEGLLDEDAAGLFVDGDGATAPTPAVAEVGSGGTASAPADEGPSTDNDEPDAPPGAQADEPAPDPSGDVASPDAGDAAPSNGEDGDEAATDGAEPEPDPAAGAADELYEFTDEERAEVEAEYGAEFATGDELDEPAASTDAGGAEPTPADLEGGTDDTEVLETATDDADADGDDHETAADEPDEGTEDLEAVVLEHMRELDAGDGVDRAALTDAVGDATEASRAAIDDAIQDALMSGSCYEPSEDRLKPI